MIRKDVIRLVDGQGWYVETKNHHDGPFGTREEASGYLSLLSRVSAAGIACSWLTRDGNSRPAYAASHR